MIKFSPYITIYDLNKGFKAVDAVIWSFSKNLKGIGTARERFNIHLVDNKDSERQQIQGSIKSIWKYFDKNRFEKESLSTQKEILLDLITDSFFSVATELDWDKAMIGNAKERSLDDGIEFEFVSKPRLNSSKSKSGSVKLKLKENKVSIYVVLKAKNEIDTKEILMLDSFPHHISTFKTFNEYKWLNEEDFGFVFSNGLSLTCSFNEPIGTWNHRDTEESNGFIRSVTYKEFSSENERIKWMNN